MPPVSVIVPNYNHAWFLPQRLDSIFAQTFKDYELIVLDDASTDNSREVLERYAAKNPMQLVFNEKNSGSPFAQWQKGARLATGKYLWIAESDDFADQHFLERLVRTLDQHPNVGLAYCQSFYVDADGRAGGSCEEWNQSLDQKRWREDFVNSGRNEIARFLILQNSIPNASAALVRTELFQRAVHGAETRRLSGDWWTWVRILMESDVAFVAQPLNNFRMHGQSVRDTTQLTAICAEEFSLKAYICSQVAVARNLRRRAFYEQYSKWRKCVKNPAFFWDWNWLKSVYCDANKIWPMATLRMGWCIARTRVERAWSRS
jgi:glycosyltransferase involved in cell wall biosynthesis